MSMSAAKSLASTLLRMPSLALSWPLSTVKSSSRMRKRLIDSARDTGALAERLVALLTDPATARAMGDKGRAWVERDWSWDLTAARLRALLE